MNYKNALRGTETFVPGEGHPKGTVLHGSSWWSNVGGAPVRDPLFSGNPSGIRSYLVGSVWGETWSAPCAWNSNVLEVIDVRPALDLMGHLGVQSRLRTLRLRARERGLQVVISREDTPEEAAERAETSEAMGFLQADSLFDRG